MTEASYDHDGYLTALGEDVVIAGVTYKGIVEVDYEQVEFGRLQVQSTAPTVLMKTTDTDKASVVNRTSITLRERVTATETAVYLVSELEPDGFGMTLLRLYKDR